jgi:hypothetical protein
VKVRGVFPAAGSVQFIPTDIVDEAMSREAIHDKNDPVIIGVDCARFGDNDTVIFTRIGNDGRSFGFERYNGLDSTQIAERVIDVIQRLNNLGKRVSGLFIDGGGRS